MPQSDTRHRTGRKGIAAAVILTMLASMCALAPLYARHMGAAPFESHIQKTTEINGQVVPVLQENQNILQLGYTPIGPQWSFGPYALGADAQGRDVAARLLYGGRNSLMIAVSAAVISLLVATILSLWAGYVGGWVERVVMWLMTMLWAVPVYLFASCLSMTMLQDSLHFGGFTLEADNLMVPILIISLVYLPYATRVLMARVQQITTAEYITVAEGFGASAIWICIHEILPGLVITLTRFFPLLVALCLLAESALSFLSLGVQAPDVSWGSMIHDGEGLIYARPTIAVLPGLMIVMTVLSLYSLAEAFGSRLERRFIP